MIPLADIADAPTATAALSDAEVVARVRAGEQALFEVLLRRGVTTGDARAGER